MMKSWADHCSSDEDTDDNQSVNSVDEDEQSLDAGFSEKVQMHDDPPEEHVPEAEPPVRTYDFPEHPPFTAFVGNLSYDIQEPSQLQQALADVIFDRLGQRINVIGGRISYDRESKNRQHRGFGYVELETLEELKLVMKLNDDAQALLAGRKVQVDTANNHHRPNNSFNRRGGRGSHFQNNNPINQRGSFTRRNSDHLQNDGPVEKIDGSKFRGGKFNNNTNNNNNNSNNNNYRKNSFRNNNNNNNSDAPAGDAPRQRPSLKLAPRSKPIDGGARSSSSNIFGGAKARDAQAWEKNRQQQKDEQKGGEEKKKKTTSNEENSKKDTKKDHHDRRQSGRGGKGRGNENQRRGSTRRQQYEKKNDKRQHQPSPEEKAAAAAKATANNSNSNKQEAAPSNPEPKAPKNKFALLMDSDSD